MKHSERFLNAFISIEMQLKEMLKINHLPFTQLVSRGAKINDVIEYYEFDLIEFSQLRNAITHNRVGNFDEVIAEPHLLVVEEIEQIANVLKHPKKVVDCFKRKVYYVQSDEKLKTVLEEKGKQSYSIVPVYRKKQFVGVLNDLVISRWFIDHLDHLDISSLTIDDFLQYKMKEERVVFTDAKCTVYQALRIFSKQYHDGHRITALILTQTGMMNEFPLRILTVADIPTLLHERK